MAKLAQVCKLFQNTPLNQSQKQLSAICVYKTCRYIYMSLDVTCKSIA